MVMNPVRAPVFFPGEEILSDVQAVIRDPWSNKGSSKGSVQYPTRRLTFSVDAMSWKKNMYPDLSVNFLAPVICFVITQKFNVVQSNRLLDLERFYTSVGTGNEPVEEVSRYSSLI